MMDDLIDAEFGEHDYDWLLMPPETHLQPSLNSKDHQIRLNVTKGGSMARSMSATRARASRASTSQVQNSHSAKHARSSSLARPSISNTHNSTTTTTTTINSRTSALNNSVASITSRPTPRNRLTITKPSPTSPRLPVRTPTPAKSSPTPISPRTRTTKSQNSRSSTNLNAILTSSPRKPTSTLSPSTTGRAPSVSRVRNPATAAPLPSSPSPRARARAPVQPIDILEFPSDTPPNLRTRLLDRATSAGRMHTGTALTARPNHRHSLPVASQSKFSENSPKDQSRSNRHHAAPSEIQRSIVVDGEVKRSNKTGVVKKSNGFGRTISKKSLDMALRHMDIKHNILGIHSKASKGKPAGMSDAVVPVTTAGVLAENGRCSGFASPDCNKSVPGNGDLATSRSPRLKPIITRGIDLDLYGSCRYDAMLLKEDSSNMNWLHNVEDMSDQSSVFDHGFEPLPEPFGFL